MRLFSCSLRLVIKMKLYVALSTLVIILMAGVTSEAISVERPRSFLTDCATSCSENYGEPASPVTKWNRGDLESEEIHKTKLDFCDLDHLSCSGAGKRGHSAAAKAP